MKKTLIAAATLGAAMTLTTPTPAQAGVHGLISPACPDSTFCPWFPAFAGTIGLVMKGSK